MPGTPDTRPSETIVAFDFGTRRIGVAVGQDVTGSASPVAAVKNSRSGPDWEAIERLVREWLPSRLVVGMPLNADGKPADLAGQVEAFIAALGRFGLPVEQVDESYSSLEAGELLKSARAAGLRGRIGKGDIDSVAAALIAEQWLRSRLR